MHSRTVLTLVRHGETPANLDGLWHGSIDSPLTPRGLEQAARVARHIATAHPDASAVYSSHLQRARVTADAIARLLGLEPRSHDGLREYDLGSWEGKPFAELMEVQRLWHHIKLDPDFAPHGGESPRDVVDRFTAALHELAARHPGERIVLVTHGGALSMALGVLFAGRYGEWHPVMQNCAVSELVFEPAPELLSFNVTEHLAGL